MGRFAGLRNFTVGLSPLDMTWEDWKPIIRSAIAGWLGLLFMLIPRTLTFLGQASYLVLVASSADPPSGPIVKVVYDSAYNLLFAGSSWAWYVAASKAATLARPVTYSAASLAIPNLSNFQCDATPEECFSTAIFAGEFVEARSSIIWAAFFWVAIVFYLYLKVSYPARPIPIILGMVSMIVPFMYGPLFPYFYPTLGEVIFYPFAVQCAINTVCSAIFWPRSMNHIYVYKVQGLLGAIGAIADLQQEILRTDPRDESAWSRLNVIKAKISAAKAGLGAFGPLEALLVREFQYGRLGADDLRDLTMSCRDIILKFGGLGIFYDLVSQQISPPHEKSNRESSENTTPPELNGGTPVGPMDSESCHNSVTETPNTSQSNRNSHEDLTRQVGFTANHDRLDEVSQKLVKDPVRRDRKKHAHFNFKSPKHHLHSALHHEYRPVGIFEMHEYGERESRFPRKNEVEFLLKMLKLASGSTEELFRGIQGAVKANSNFLTNINKDRLINRVFKRRRPQSSIESLRDARDALQTALDNFASKGRLKQLEPYESLQSHSFGTTPHRPLLRMFYLEFSLIRFGETTLKMTQKCINLELQRPAPRLYIPGAFFGWNFKSQCDTKVQARSQEGKTLFEEDIEDEMMVEEDPYMTEMRDPDHGPPRHWYHLLGRALVRSGKISRHPSLLFALKASVCVSLVSLPAHLRSSAGWFYHDRGMWAVIMASFTQAPFTGDTIFLFIWRLFGTFVGAVLGCVLWYMGDGGGNGQPFGLAAVMVVGFMLIMYIRLRWVLINPQPAIFLVITNSLIIGYSWQDTHQPTAASVGAGFSAAWRRFLVVLIGISAAFVWSFFPKPTTGRQVIRRRLAGGTFEIGNIFVRVSNWARDPNRKRGEEEEIRRMVVKANGKLLIITQRLQFASYEPSIQGPWPREKYERMLTIQREILDLLSSFVSNLTYMEKVWTEPLLRRTGWYDRELMGDCLAVVFMAANAIKTGVAVPQTVPSPLIDRFYDRMERLQESQAEGSLPRVITRETMEDPGYASFAVGSVVTFAIITRIDMLLLITKELVGEFWHTKYFEDMTRYHQLAIA